MKEVKSDKQLEDIRKELETLKMSIKPKARAPVRKKIVKKVVGEDVVVKEKEDVSEKTLILTPLVLKPLAETDQDKIDRLINRFKK